MENSDKQEYFYDQPSDHNDICVILFVMTQNSWKN
jgi:hypothetical protein